MSIDHFSGSQCLEFIALSDLRLEVLYQPIEVQIATRAITKLGVTLPHWSIAPIPGETLAFEFLRDLHARFQVMNVRQGNGYSRLIFTGEQRIDLYQTSFGLPSYLPFGRHEIETHYSRSLKRLNKKTTEI